MADAAVEGFGEGVQLDEVECWQRLRGVRDGRLAVTYRAMPWVTPAAFAVDGEVLVFNSRPDVLERAAERHEVVCFEAGASNDDDTEHWTVRVLGRLSFCRDTGLTEAIRSRLALSAWSSTGRYIRLDPEQVCGDVHLSTSN